MKIIILPFILVLVPILILFITLHYLAKHNRISTSLKIGFGIFFVALGILATFYATLMSIEGIAENGIQCATGAVFFIFSGILVNLAGIPLLLIFFRNTPAKISNINRINS